MARTRRVIVYITAFENGIDREIEVECSVSPGTPDRGPDMACAGGYPGDPPEVEVICARDAFGPLLPETLGAFLDAHLSRIEELALEQYEEDASDAEDERAEQAAEARREREWDEDKVSGI